MSIRTLKSYLEDQLKIYPDIYETENDFNAEFDFAIEVFSGITKKDMILGADISDTQEMELKEIFSRRFRTREPLAQILGYCIFMGEKFKVSKHTLIPRPETELLIIKAIEKIKENDYTTVLDIGTGTGCIACMIAKNTQAQVLGLDISNEALHVSLENAMALELMNRAIFRKSDIFSSIDYIHGEKFDMIVSNPPYIPKHIKSSLQPEVRDYEPELALFTEDEYGIENYEKIISQAKNYLKPHGYVLFELGIDQSGIVSDLFKYYGFSEIEVFKDVSGIDRVISARAM